VAVTGNARGAPCRCSPEEGTVCNLCAKADDEHDQAVALVQRVLGGVVIESGLTHDRPDTGPRLVPARGQRPAR
jgi:hypothetical protein